MLKRTFIAAALIVLTAAQCLAAQIYVTEFSIGTTANTQVARQPAIAEQTVSIGSSSTQSSAFNSDTKLIRVHADATCSIKIGSNPTATASPMRMAADSTEYFEVKPGDKIAVITNN